jgi:hypothetical protein
MRYVTRDLDCWIVGILNQNVDRFTVYGLTMDSGKLVLTTITADWKLFAVDSPIMEILLCDVIIPILAANLRRRFDQFSFFVAELQLLSLTLVKGVIFLLDLGLHLLGQDR